MEVIRRSGNYLAKRGVESPRLQVELMLAHVLRVPRLKLYLEFDRMLGEQELDATRELVRRRGSREPLQHLLGTANFCGLELEVNRGVLVPRPETEVLAERAWTWLRDSAGAMRPQSETGADALDWGCGSGCLAIAIAVNAPEIRVHAVDISGEALAVARRNAVRHGVAERIVFFEGDGIGGLPEGARYGLVVSNPPYIPSGDIGGLDPEVRDHDPRVALDGGADGMVFYRRLAVEAAGRLADGGRMMMEFGDGQEAGVSGIFGAGGWRVEEVAADLSGAPRILIACRAD